MLAIARPGALSSDGSFAQPVAAVADEEPTATPWAYIDKNIYNGDYPCDPDAIDDVTTEIVGTSHSLAICLGNVSDLVTQFEFEVTYDNKLDTCTEIDCDLRTDLGCLDDNPDFYDDSFSGEWRCSYLTGTAAGDFQAANGAFPEPMCDVSAATPEATPGPSQGRAYIHCVALDGDSVALGGDGLESGALAVLNLKVADTGTDSVDIDKMIVWGTDDGEPMAQCGFDAADLRAATLPGPGGFEMPCVGATDIKTQYRRPTLTPTEEPTATATRVPPTVAPTLDHHPRPPRSASPARQLSRPPPAAAPQREAALPGRSGWQPASSGQPRQEGSTTATLRGHAN